MVVALTVGLAVLLLLVLLLSLVWGWIRARLIVVKSTSSNYQKKTPLDGKQWGVNACRLHFFKSSLKFEKIIIIDIIMTHRTQLGINSRCFGICNNYNKLLLRYKYTSYPYPWYHKIRVLFSCVKQFRPQSLNNSVHILKVTYKCDQPVQSSLNSLCTGKNSCL